MKLRDAIREHVIRTLDEHEGNRTHAAKALGIDRRTLHRMLRRFSSELVFAPTNTKQLELPLPNG